MRFKNTLSVNFYFRNIFKDLFHKFLEDKNTSILDPRGSKPRWISSLVCFVDCT